MATERIGIFEDMTFEEYAADSGMNASKIVNMRRSPMKYLHERNTPSPPTPAMEMGTLVHRMILEPGLVGNIAVWGEEENQKTRRGKVWDGFRELHKDNLILTVAERDDALGQTQAVLNHAPIFKYARAEGPTELSLFWRHPFTRRRFKARIDKLIPETHTIFDLKTTCDCHSYRFGAQAYRLGYHIKIAHYCEGYEVLTGAKPHAVLGAMDSKKPYESAVYRVTEDVRLQGLEERDTLLGRIDDCEKAGRWPAEYDQESDLILPPWARDSEFEVEDTM